MTGGSSDAVSSVPDDSVVWSLVPDGQTKAFVFVQAPNDPNAPTVCHRQLRRLSKATYGRPRWWRGRGAVGWASVPERVTDRPPAGMKRR